MTGSPMPTYRPMLARSVDVAPAAKNLDYEVKWDGFRAGIVINGSDEMRLISRHGTDLLSWFPELRDIARQIRAKSAIVDGEIIAGDGSIASFNDLQRRARARGRRVEADISEITISYVAFDLLWLNGNHCTQLPLRLRRKKLEAIVSEDNPLAVSRVFQDGAALYAAAIENGLEGIVIKDRSSIYEPGKRQRTWLKCKVPRAWEGHDWRSRTER